jgi:hypothetical protein
MKEQRTDTVDETPQSPARRVYRPPSLKYLGSVRELTLGGSSGKKRDGGGATRRP